MMTGMTRYHPAVFLITFFAYALFHMVRKSLSFVKSSITSEWTPTDWVTAAAGRELSCPQQTWRRADSLFEDKASAETFLGVLNATFLFLYALGLYVSGVLADRLDLRVLLSAGMLLSAVAIFVFGPVLQWTGATSQPAYLALMVANGLLQSVGWPIVVAVMGNWFGKTSRGFVLGLWSASPSIGSILGALIAASVVDYGYEYVFVLTSSSLFAGGVVVFFGLVSSPREVGLPMPDEGDEKQVEAKSSCNADKQGKTDTTEQKRQETESTSCSSHPPQGMSVAVILSNGQNPSSSDSWKPSQHKDVHRVFYGSTEQQASFDGGTSSDTKPDQMSTTRLASNGHTWPVSQCKRASEETSLLNTTNGSVRSVTAYQNLALEIEIDLTDTLSSSARSDSLADDRNKDPRKPGEVTVEEFTTNQPDPSRRPQAINFFRAILLPGVINYSLVFACIKMVNYVFFFWLPFYLSKAYGWPQSEADKLSVWFDVGGIFGGTLAGVLGNRFQKRGLVIGPMLVLSIPMLYVYGTLPAARQPVVNAVMLVVLGVFVGGVANIISSAICADLGRQDAIRGNLEALSTVTGIIEGTGTLGAALGQVAVPYLDSAYGWKSVFYLLMVATAMTVLNILPIVRTEVKEVMRNRQQRR